MLINSYNIKILVTGGNGLLGKSISERLANDYNVYCLSRNLPTSISNRKISYLSVDLSKRESIPIILKIKPKIIIHCATILPSVSSIGEEDAYKINYAIDKNIITVAQNLYSYLVYLSSTIVYGLKDNDFNIKEDQVTCDTSFYGKLKIESESSIKNVINKYLILRINAPYGKNMVNKTVISIFTRLALDGNPLQYHGSGARMQDFTNVEDIAQLIFNVLRDNNYPKGIFNISFGAPISMKELAKLIVDITGSRSEIEPSGQADIQENYRASYSIKKAQDVLGWNPRISLNTGILELINRFKENADSIHF